MLTFLASVPLESYRSKYASTKIVEMDLPKNIQILDLANETYWENKDYKNFENFYEDYLKLKLTNINEFNKKIGMCADCFQTGLKARIYRTWASLITQIHAGYVAEHVFGAGSVTMNEQLDRKGIDLQVKYKSLVLNYQIKKNSSRPEARPRKKKKQLLSELYIDLFYFVVQQKIIDNPYTLRGEMRKPYRRFMENKELMRLPNGFIVFTEEAFKKTKSALDLD